MAHREIDYSKMADKYESLAIQAKTWIVREYFHRDPTAYGEAFISITRNMIR